MIADYVSFFSLLPLNSHHATSGWFRLHESVPACELGPDAIIPDPSPVKFACALSCNLFSVVNFLASILFSRLYPKSFIGSSSSRPPTSGPLSQLLPAPTFSCSFVRSFNFFFIGLSEWETEGGAGLRYFVVPFLVTLLSSFFILRHFLSRPAFSHIHACTARRVQTLNTHPHPPPFSSSLLTLAIASPPRRIRTNQLPRRPLLFACMPVQTGVHRPPLHPRFPPKSSPFFSLCAA